MPSLPHSIYICGYNCLYYKHLLEQGNDNTEHQGSHFFGLTKFHDISMIFPDFFSKFPGIFSLFLKYDFQAVLNI